MSVPNVRPNGSLLTEIALTFFDALSISLLFAIVIIWVCG